MPNYPDGPVLDNLVALRARLAEAEAQLAEARTMLAEAEDGYRRWKRRAGEVEARLAEWDASGWVRIDVFQAEDEALQAAEARLAAAESWPGFAAWIERIYPASIFTGVSGDLGPKLVNVVRAAVAEIMTYIPDAAPAPDAPAPLGEEGDHAQ